MEKSEGSLRRKSMNPVSPLFEKIDASIEKKANLFENSFSRYAVRAVRLFVFDFRNGCGICDRDEGKISRMV